MTQTSLNQATLNAKAIHGVAYNGITLAWFGGPSIYGYNAKGEEVCFWTMGSRPYDDNYTTEEAIASMKRSADTNYFPY